MLLGFIGSWGDTLIDEEVLEEIARVEPRIGSAKTLRRC